MIRIDAVWLCIYDQLMPSLLENHRFEVKNPSVFPNRRNLCMVVPAATTCNGGILP
jgi:hypothetical protein